MNYSWGPFIKKGMRAKKRKEKEKEKEKTLKDALHIEPLEAGLHSQRISLFTTKSKVPLET